MSSKFSNSHIPLGSLVDLCLFQDILRNSVLWNNLHSVHYYIFVLEVMTEFLFKVSLFLMFYWYFHEIFFVTKYACTCMHLLAVKSFGYEQLQKNYKGTLMHLSPWWIIVHFKINCVWFKEPFLYYTLLLFGEGQNVIKLFM